MSLQKSVKKPLKFKALAFMAVFAVILQMSVFSTASAVFEVNWAAGNASGGTGTSTATSFTGFTGGLDAPSATGYSSGLTQATTAREYILNVTNFALGFLGILAVIIIIYGGFLYLTAAGNETQAGKGKKAVMYAVIGLLIIMGSFAIVTTVLQAPSGSEQQRGSATQATGAATSLNFNTHGATVQTIAKNIVSAYFYHFQVKTDLATARDLINEAFRGIETCSGVTPTGTAPKNPSLTSGNCGTDWDNGIRVKLDELKAATDNAKGLLENAKNNLSSDSLDAMAIGGNITAAEAYLDNFWGSAINRAQTQAGKPETVLLLATPNIATAADGVKSIYKEALGSAKWNDDLFKADTGLFTLAETAVLDNFSSIVNAGMSGIKDIYDQVSVITDAGTAGTSAYTAFNDLVAVAVLATPGTPNSQTISQADGSMKKLREAVKSSTLNTSPSDESKTPYSELIAAIGNLKALFDLLNNVKFVNAKLSATVAEGNAPLTVSFSSVGSADPSGLTIQDSQISWDLDGNGTYNLTPTDKTKFVGCDETSTSTVTCTYMHPGTYRVSLKINAADQTDAATGKKYSQEIGAGIGAFTIKVNPPQNKINLTIDNETINNGPIDVIKYDKNGFLQVNRSSVSFLASKAKNVGVIFNAIPTVAKDGPIVDQSSQGATVKWDYGDKSVGDNNNTTLAASVGNLKQTHKYEKEGTYTVTVEIADKNRIVDRKIFSLVITSIVPLITVTPSAPNVGDEVLFDGSDSMSDNGQINTFTWSFDPNLKPVPTSKDDKVTYKIVEPGTYNASLNISDAVTTSTSPATETVSVTSKAPVAQFTDKVLSASQPGTIQFDGTPSYDPDGTADEQLSYEWAINGSVLETGADFAYVNSKHTDAKPTVKFNKLGTYKVSLVVSDPKGLGFNPPTPQPGDPVEKEIIIDNILDIAWAPTDSPSGILQTNTAGTGKSADITLNLVSENGVSYEVDYGDGQKQNGDITKTVALKHTYTEAGTFIVSATVFDAEDNENTLKRKIYIGSSNPGGKPVAVISLQVNGQDILVEPAGKVTINRKDVVGFDASQSKNLDGTGRRLNYSWDLGDGTINSQKTLNHKYDDVGKYTVTLTARNAEDVSQSATDKVDIEVVGQPPMLRSVTVVPTTSNLTTPVTVQVNAVGASDPDGQVVRYRWWYFEEGDTASEYGAQITASPSATMTIGTRGNENEKKTYIFAVELTDNENNNVSSLDLLAKSTWPTLTVTNGPNKSPIAQFNVDRTTIFVNESVEFSSSSTDPDGKIVSYFWDWEGNGFADNTVDEGPSVSHVFAKAAKDGIQVRLKVVDNNGSETVSSPVTIYVDSKGKPPTAAFTAAQQPGTKTVKFTNISTADTASGLSLTKYEWNFGDKVKGNYVDSTEKEPTHAYPDYTYYSVKLTVTDSDGMTNSVVNFITLKAPVVPRPAAPAVPALDARLLTTPAPSFLDNKVHLTGQTANVTLDFSQSVGNITKYIIDKNILFDTNGNGNPSDDEDYTATKPGSWTTSFSRAYGAITVRLTVIDAAGNKKYVDKQIIFDPIAGSLFSADVMAAAGGSSAALIVSAAGFAILYFRKKITKQK